jgi:hypothetical protein
VITYGILWCLHYIGGNLAYLKGEARRATISAPCADAPMLVMDMNHENYNSIKDVNNASSTI